MNCLSTILTWARPQTKGSITGKSGEERGSENAHFGFLHKSAVLERQLSNKQSDRKADTAKKCHPYLMAPSQLFRSRANPSRTAPQENNEMPTIFPITNPAATPSATGLAMAFANISSEKVTPALTSAKSGSTTKLTHG